ncbi:MAG: arsenite methyltransferase [Phycisphaerae bacterium]
MGRKPRILFLCTGNSCRSQMAEGWARHLKREQVDAYSAGTRPQGLNRLAVQAMAESGVDISQGRSKSIDDLGGIDFDYVVTVCGHVNETCPVFPSRTRLFHVGFEDPPTLAVNAMNDAEALPHYRRVRDEIRLFVEKLPQALFEAHLSMETETMNAQEPSTAEEVRQTVREGYAEIATRGTTRGSGGCCGPAGSCCGGARIAARVGYDPGDLDNLPAGADMGLSCGNPTAIASLKPGETVVDLGSGGGFDCFIAGPKVGATGRVIGIDMTPEMLMKARRGVAAYRQRSGLDNVEFRLGEIEHLPVADRSADVVISNCVLNLSPEKSQVWREVARVLRPGGRVAVSDLALLRPLPAQVREMIEALVGCVAGAVLVDETERMMRDAGFIDISLTAKPEYVKLMSDTQDPLYHKIMEHLPPGTNASDFITSLDISARRR